MDPSQWQRIEDLFHEVLLLPSDKRQAYLTTACSDNDALRHQVETLIVSYESDRSLLEKPALSLGWRLLSDRTRQSLTGRILGQYHIVRLLGQGGMGQVYLAKDTKLERLVALKFLADEWGARLMDEATVLARLEHPNICSIHNVEEIDDYRFIVMQYVEGETLASLVLQPQPLAVDRILRLATQIVSALCAAHGSGIVHRDIKPQNIVVTADEKIKILDFGLAKIAGEIQAERDHQAGDPAQSSQFSLMIGTLPYMSPEQLEKKSLDGQTDIFSFGIVLFELLSGKNPFRRDNDTDTLAAIRDFDPPSLNSTNKLGAELERVARKCIAKDRSLRFQTSAELLADLERLSKTPDARITSLSASARRRRRTFAAVATILFVLASIVAVLLYIRVTTVRTLAVVNVATQPKGNAETDLGEGLSRGLAQRLSRLSRLQVKTPREASVMEQDDGSFASAARELGVELLLVNRIVKRDAASVLQASLLRTSDGSRLWEKEFPIDGKDLITLTIGVTQEVTFHLNIWVTNIDQALIAKRQTENAKAFELYLRGQDFLSRRGETNLKTAIKYFEDAIEKDALYAPALAGLAECYALRTTVANGQESRPEMVNKARAAAKKALLIDDTLAEAHTALGIIQMRDEWKWKESEASFRKAIDLNSDFAPAHWWYSLLLMTLKRNDEALAESKLANTLEPFSASTQINIGRAYFYARQYDRAAEALTAVLQKDERNESALYMLGLVYLAQKNYSEGIKSLDRLYGVNPLYAAAPLGFAYGKLNRRDDAMAVLNKLEELSKAEVDKPVPAQEKAIIYIGLNDLDKAFILLEEAYDERFSSLISLTTDPLFEDLRTDRRFADLARRLDLKP